MIIFSILRFFGLLAALRTWTLSLFHRPWPRLYIGRHLSRVSGPAIVLFPLRQATFCCGIAGILAYKRPFRPMPATDLESTLSLIDGHILRLFELDAADQREVPEPDHDRQEETGRSLLEKIRNLKRPEPLYAILQGAHHRQRLRDTARFLEQHIQQETSSLRNRMTVLSMEQSERWAAAIELFKDIHWTLSTELLDNLPRIEALAGPAEIDAPEGFALLCHLNAVLNSIDRLEVRGRDSAGVSILMQFLPDVFHLCKASWTPELERQWSSRLNPEVLTDGSIAWRSAADAVHVAFTFKVAAEIGSLGDNIAAIRNRIANDELFHRLRRTPITSWSIIGHTRWASVGAITLPNCHPVDNRAGGIDPTRQGIVHACLNGDIDNFTDLKRELEAEGITIPESITTDTKIIPLMIARYLREGLDVPEAFRQTVNRFHGSHAIAMHTDLAPGKLFLAQRGSGQALFVGLAPNHLMPASEVYGFVEETQQFIKLEGEKLVQTETGSTQGQIVILDRESAAGPEAITSFRYDGTPVRIDATSVKTTEITSRDIDRQVYPHYFLKEISEAPASIEKTLLNRWKIDEATGIPRIVLPEKAFPKNLADALIRGDIRRIWFIGQGTAGVAAQACADLHTHYLADSGIQIAAMKASELSGFRLTGAADADGMTDTLVVAISQSGTTADTNRTVDMVRERGARTLAIVNRRDSDLTFKVDGVLYTSSGRDIEMSVASTKAFYSQIVAGALLGLQIAQVTQRRSPSFIADEIRTLERLPQAMRTLLEHQDRMRESAHTHALSRVYWAVVGSGHNKAAADEIRIKLSELCYKTISTDYVEDKKHIDLSSEPLILVCAAGSPEAVIGDIQKDTAIFKAHKSCTIVIAEEEDNRFDPYADDVLRVPSVAPHLSPIVNTLAGHLWGYYAALTIHGCSRFLYEFREDLQATIDTLGRDGLDVYEIVLEKTFREKIAAFYIALREKRSAKNFCADLGISGLADLPLVLKYLAGRLPVADFELDFNRKGTAANMIATLFACLNQGIEQLARPIDAIKHQAKTVTVGTSRIQEEAAMAGILFDTLLSFGFNQNLMTPINVRVLKNLQEVVDRVQGAILYKVQGLSLLGEPTDTTTITILEKTGTLKPLSSRVETDPALRGTKRIIAKEGNVFIGRGRKDGRSIIIIPILADRRPQTIEHILLLHIAFKTTVSLENRIKALGGKLDRIRNIVQENSVSWNDVYLEWISLEDLFGQSAEKTAEAILTKAGEGQ
uniref:Glutamine--fructose-6-phosphate aminotransferase [isomerizing] n=1 Tax=Desulfatirhabdium butyrativorans TaxID=340467 RepID=A0A7C4MLH9_9BACT